MSCVERYMKIRYQNGHMLERIYCAEEVKLIYFGLLCISKCQLLWEVKCSTFGVFLLLHSMRRVVKYCFVRCILLTSPRLDESCSIHAEFSAFL